MNHTLYNTHSTSVSMRKDLIILSTTITLVLAAMSLSGCNNPQSHNVTVGPLTATGTLTSTGVSLLRRGTHVLTTENNERFYLESRNQNLEEYAGQHVVVQGTVEPNIDTKYLPVIVVNGITSLDGSHGLHAWRIPALNILIQTPDDWTGELDNTTATFHRKNDAYPLLTIIKKSDTKLPSGGTLSRIRGHAATTIDRKADLAQDVYILDGTHTLSLHFNADQSSLTGVTTDLSEMTQPFATLLSSLQFLSDTPSSQATGSGSSLACGGTAGVLCPSGYYCDITDRTLNIGRCKSI